jgi:hypothetical protein
MTGFLSGIAVNIACGQLSDLTGAPARGAFPLARAVDVLSHPARMNLASVLTGLGALAHPDPAGPDQDRCRQRADRPGHPDRAGRGGRRGQRRESQGRR